MNNKIKRILATVVDISLIIFIVYITTLIENNFTKFTDVPINTGIFLGVFYLYFILPEFFFQTTVGKNIFKIKLDIQKKSFLNLIKIVLRNLFNLLELIVPILYIIPVLVWNKKLGEYLSKTELVYE
ncbi:RDD family protein [Aquimarina sp. SS2-1]|uniref:RDD family protein n=1 Tax=Aquimarina besae TaxID=3342247 RepID=UPI00366F66B6